MPRCLAETREKSEKKETGTTEPRRRTAFTELPVQQADPQPDGSCGDGLSPQGRPGAGTWRGASGKAALSPTRRKQRAGAPSLGRRDGKAPDGALVGGPRGSRRPPSGQQGPPEPCLDPSLGATGSHGRHQIGQCPNHTCFDRQSASDAQGARLGKMKEEG